jgi:tape measure domain-containing protein
MADVERLRIILEANMAQYTAALNSAQAQTNAKLGAIEKRFDQATARMKSSAVSLGGVMGTIGAYLTVDQVIGYANAWTRVVRSLDAGEQVFGITLKSAAELNALASEARIDVEAYTKTYIRAAAAIRDYGYDSDTAAKVTTTLAKALKLGGAAASEQSSTILQFSQALQKGKLDGDEFRTVMENAGVIQELLARRLKVTKGEIVTMAGQGKLKLQDLVGAMTDGAEQVNAVFNQMPATIDEAFTVLNNSITQFVGKMDQVYGISQSVAGAMQFLAENIDTVGKAALVAGIGLLAMFAPAIIAGVASVGVAAVATAGSVGLLTGSVAAGAAAFELFGAQVAVSKDGVVSFKDVVIALSEELAASADVADEAGQSYLESIGKLASMGKGIAGALPVIGPMIHAVDALTAAWKAASEAEGSFADRVRSRARERALGRGFADSTTVSRTPGTPTLAPPPVDKAAERARKAFEKDLLNLENRIALEKNEAETIGRSAEQVEYMRTRQELLNEARKAGIVLTDADMIKIDALSASMARAVTNTENLQRAYEDMASESKALMSQFIIDMKDGASASEALGSALDKIANKLIDMAVNDLVEVALGGLTGRGGNPAQAGLAGGLMSLFGFAKGGIAAHGRPLQRFAGGGVSNSAAIFGEAGPEAAVPLPDGRRIPVDLRMPGAANAGGGVNVTIAPVFNVENGTAEGVDKMKADVMPKIREVVRTELANQFDRNPRFARSGI